MNKKELTKRAILHSAGILIGDDWKTVNFPSYLNVDRILDYVLCVSDLIYNLGDHSLLDE